MWFYVVAIIVVILVALLIRRSNLYRHFRNRQDPGQAGSGHSGGHYEGQTGARGQSTGGGPGSG
jgi:hypothetical protein